MAKKKRNNTSVYNYGTGKHQKAAVAMNSSAWWNVKLGIGNKAGEGAIAKGRKERQDKKIKESGG